MPTNEVYGMGALSMEVQGSPPQRSNVFFPLSCPQGETGGIGEVFSI